jgi:PHD/YefM family antitoxin component YafN of YafNO toxin-antitoxin module
MSESKVKIDEKERILSNPAMVKRLEESRKQIKKSKGVKVNLDDIWK